MLGCPNPACGVWLHEECAVDALLSRAYDRLLPWERDSREKPRRSYTNRLEGMVMEGGNQVRVNDLLMKSAFTRTIRCLKCKALFL